MLEQLKAVLASSRTLRDQLESAMDTATEPNRRMIKSQLDGVTQIVSVAQRLVQVAQDQSDSATAAAAAAQVAAATAAAAAAAANPVPPGAPATK